MNQFDSVVDIMQVPLKGDASIAVVRVPSGPPLREITTEILVVGGGMGGIAAAWSALRSGRRVCLLEETDWVGGQVTSQGVAALDEHEHIETFGGTRSYYQFREAVRDVYRQIV